MLFAALIFIFNGEYGGATCLPGQISNFMSDNDVLRGGQALVSSDGLKMLLMDTDGSLKLIDQQIVYWSKTFPNPKNRFLVLQWQGNFVIYDSCGQSICPVWASETELATAANPSGIGPYHLFLQNDRNLILIDGNEKVLWASNTVGASVPDGTRLVCQACPAGTYSSAFGDLCASCSIGKFSGTPSIFQVKVISQSENELLSQYLGLQYAPLVLPATTPHTRQVVFLSFFQIFSMLVPIQSRGLV
jgi:hypothetical protein